MGTIHLNRELEKTFEQMLMIGIVKTLRDEAMLSDAQLNLVIQRIENKPTYTSQNMAV